MLIHQWSLPVISGTCDEPGQDPGHAGALEQPSSSSGGGMDLMTALVLAPAVLWLLGLVYDRMTRS